MINIGGAFGTTENSTMTINNVTTGLSSTISTTIQHNADGNVNYVLASPLAVSNGDILQVRWISPTWVTNPTTVRQRFNVKII